MKRYFHRSKVWKIPAFWQAGLALCYPFDSEEGNLHHLQLTMSSKSSEPPSKKLPQDDRNLVVVDKDFADADVEDRVWLFWKRNRATIIAAIIIVCAAVLGNTLYQFWQVRHLENVQQAYLTADTPEAMLAFVKEYGKEPLGAIAQVQLADIAYEGGRFEEAAAGYAQALNAIEVPELAQRARLGEAIALIRAGKDPSYTKLAALAQDALALDAYRAQAAYQLAVLAAQAKDYAGARAWIEQIAALPYAGTWALQAQQLVQMKPEILKAQAPQSQAEGPQADKPAA